MGCCASKGSDDGDDGVAKWGSQPNRFVALRTARLKTFSDEVLDLDRSVQTLDLTHKKLVEIPMDISKFVNMQRLLLATNLIERLPINLEKLQYLKAMILDGN